MQTGLAEIIAAEKPPRVRDTWWKKMLVIVE
jgi:amino acid transporter